MASRLRTLYTGVTGDLFHRALQRKKGEIAGFTKKYNVDPLVDCESFRYIDRVEVSIDPKGRKGLQLSLGIGGRPGTGHSSIAELETTASL